MVPILLEDIPFAEGRALEEVLKSFGPRNVGEEEGEVTDWIPYNHLPTWHTRAMEHYYHLFTSHHSGDYPHACAHTLSAWQYYFESSDYKDPNFFSSLCFQIFREVLNARGLTLLHLKNYKENDGITKNLYEDILELLKNPFSDNITKPKEVAEKMVSLSPPSTLVQWDGSSKSQLREYPNPTVVSNSRGSCPFVYVLSEPSQQKAITPILHTLEKDYHLNYCDPEERESVTKHFSRDQQLQLLKDKENNPFKEPKDYILPMNSTAVFCFLDTSVMTSIDCLHRLLESQLTAKPVVVFMREDIPLQEGEKYQAYLKTLPKSGEHKFPPSFIMLLKKMYKRLAQSSVTGSYPNSCPETLAYWKKFITAQPHQWGVFTYENCYRFFKEIINSLNCNFIYMEHYEKNNEIMELFYTDLVTRLENSIPKGISAFSVAKFISPKEESYYFTELSEESACLEEFHTVTEEECVIEGNTLLSLNCTHPKIKLTISLGCIKENAFKYNHTLEELLLPEGLITIEDNAFQYCTNLRKIHIPQSVEKIGASAFSHCVSLTSVKMPENLQQLEPFTFLECTSLGSITLPSVTVLKESVFQNCYKLSQVDFGEHLIQIGDGCFDSCAVKELSFPGSLECIGNFAFAHCTLLERVSFPIGDSSVVEIGSAPFLECSLFAEIILPEDSPWHQGLFPDTSA